MEALARETWPIPHTWSADEVAEVKRELAKIETGLRKLAFERDARACKAIGRETGRQVRLKRVKGVR